MASYAALGLDSPGKDLTVQIRDLAAETKRLPAAGILVEVRAAGVCHTDVHLWEGGYVTGKNSRLEFAKRQGYGYPIVPGHEIAGIVYAMGACPPAPTILSVGDRVAIYTAISCEDCHVCHSGNTHLCSNSKQQLGFTVDGGYAQYVSVPHWKYAIRLPPSISMQQGCLLSCGALTAYSAIKKVQLTVDMVRKWKIELFVAVIGLGGLGQWALMLLRQYFSNTPLRVVGIDISQEKLKTVQAKNLVDDVFRFVSTDSAETTDAKFSDCFPGKKIHIVLDFVNSENTFGFSMRWVHVGGMLMSVGLHGGSFDIALPLLPLKTVTIAGTHMGSPSKMKELIEIVERGNISLSTTEYQLLDANKALHES